MSCTVNPADNPKFNPATGKVERRGRKRKQPAPEPEVDPVILLEAPKVDAVMKAVSENFGSMRDFLKAWDNQQSNELTEFFASGGAGEIVGRWLPRAVERNCMAFESVVGLVQKAIEVEAKALVKAKSVLTYSGSEHGGNTLGGSVKSLLGQMKTYVMENSPITWQLFPMRACGNVRKSNTEFTVLDSILQLSNCRNQHVNAVQTITSVFLYGNHISKPAIEVLSELNVCGSHSHLTGVLKQLSETMKKQLWEETKLHHPVPAVKGMPSEPMYENSGPGRAMKVVSVWCGKCLVKENYFCMK